MGPKVPLIELRWRSPDGRNEVVLSGCCFSKMSSFARQNYLRETGSILVGYYSNDGKYAFILDVSPIAKDSKAFPCAYTRGTKGVQQYYQRLQHNTKGRYHFVGEWHTHPNSSVIPSNCDLQTMFDIAEGRLIGCETPLLLILGGCMNTPEDVGLYWFRDRKMIRMIRV